MSGYSVRSQRSSVMPKAIATPYQTLGKSPKLAHAELAE